MTEREGDTAGSEKAPLKLLYVEDNRLNAILFEEALRLSPGLELRLAIDGEDALAQLHDWLPDVLVLDAQLPGINGFELLQQLREQPRLQQVPAFMCSADAQPAEIERALAAGFSGFWPKPIDIQQILHDLKCLAEQRSTP